MLVIEAAAIALLAVQAATATVSSDMDGPAVSSARDTAGEKLRERYCGNDTAGDYCG
jgi:hypothetical protein